MSVGYMMVINQIVYKIYVENRDLGWAGLKSDVACKNETPDEVYLIGHD